MARRILPYPSRPFQERERPALRLVREGESMIVLPFPRWAALYWRHSEKGGQHAER